MVRHSSEGALGDSPKKVSSTELQAPTKPQRLLDRKASRTQDTLDGGHQLLSAILCVPDLSNASVKLSNRDADTKSMKYRSKVRGFLTSLRKNPSKQLEAHVHAAGNCIRFAGT